MDIVYHGFTDLVKNCKYVSKNFCNIAGQGLVNTYDIIVLGTGKNIYTLRFLDNIGKRHIFKTIDNFILKWRIESSPEDIFGTEKSFEFKAFGLFDNKEYGYLYSSDIDDETLFEFSIYNLHLKEIHFQLEDLSLKPIDNICNEYMLYDEVLKHKNKMIDQYSEKYGYYESDETNKSDESE